MMRIIPFDAHGMQLHDIGVFLETFDYLKSNFDVMFEWQEQEPVPWDDLALPGFYTDFYSVHCLRISKGGAVVRLLWPKVEYEYKGGRGGDHSGVEFQVWGQVRLKRFHPHCLIRTKTMADRVQSFLSGNKLRTGHKAFDRSFQLISESGIPENFDLSNEMLEQILALDLDDIILEIKDQTLIISTRRIVEKELCLKVADFLFAL